MSDTRTYIVPDGQENSTNQMLPWMAMMNGGMGGFGNGMWNNRSCTQFGCGLCVG